MTKFDIKRAHKALYTASQEFTEVDVPAVDYFAVDGRGDPNTARSYAEAVEALYSVAYTVKFASKDELGRDYVVGPLEALWRADDPRAFLDGNKDAWEWTVMIAQPDWITGELLDAGVAKVAAKKDLPAVDQLRMDPLQEGRSVQVLHLGPYDDEASTLARLHDEYMPRHGLAFNGDHHEIYLSDPRRTAPAKLRTILRQPVKAG